MLLHLPIIFLIIIIVIINTIITIIMIDIDLMMHSHIPTKEKQEGFYHIVFS